MKNLTKTFYILFAFCLLSGCTSVMMVDAKSYHDNPQKNISLSPLLEKKWSHGSHNCDSNLEPAIDVFRFDQSSYILRQNKCLSFEAPFIYVLFGSNTVLVLDTGATEEELDFPIYKTIQSINNKLSANEGRPNRKLLVIHSHSHSDHYAGDRQFSGKPDVTVVAPNQSAMTEYFSFNQWPEGQAKVNLGGREVTIIPTPGHQEEAISVYDTQTKWLLTGDTFYPGVLYVKHWKDFKQSIARLVSFSKKHKVSAVLGAHVEMSNSSGNYYPVGTVYQPNEAPLELTIEELTALNKKLEKLDEPSRIVFDKFIVSPMNTIQKTVSNIARWFYQ
jgi:hydroxyacylglutathione hydrolase